MGPAGGRILSKYSLYSAPTCGGPLPPANTICRRAFILQSSKEMFELKLRVASVYFVCFKCFRGMLKVFHTDVTKVDWDVAHVAIVVHVCCKILFQCFICFFRRILQVCLFGHCIYFYINDASVLYGYCVYLKIFKCFWKCFRRMF